MPKLSVLIITKNEATNIRRCLESVAWADEIILVDAESTDQTVQIARQFTSKIYIRSWEGFAATKNFGLQHATGDWLLWLDADEEITPELAEEIKCTLNSSSAEGFLLPRKANFLGRWILHGGWYPAYVLRIIRREFARFEDRNVHEFLQPPSNVFRLKNPILHYTDPDIQHFFSKLNNYTSLAAQDLFHQGKNFHLLDLLFRPLHIAAKMYIFKRGFLDGLQGLLLAVFSGMYVFVKYAKLWELQKQMHQ